MGRVSVGKAADVPPGQARVVDASGLTLAVFNVNGQYYALDNACPHRGGPLGQGELDGPLVICPWHGWRWNVTSGANANNPAVKVACFPVSVEREELFVEVP